MTDSLTARLLAPSFTADVSSSMHLAGSQRRLTRLQTVRFAASASAAPITQDPQR
ncbi:hypothetical protein [Xanthomonas arboricola]|uniref:hypothetical protein n=1 Tax=Xanthomonas arboricola TaxID=56448 RepID=UPI00141AB50A|nr:hypothetical protein [Xanthomonas arboricola]